jgi:hypothetical protein
MEYQTVARSPLAALTSTMKMLAKQITTAVRKPTKKRMPQATLC